MRILRGAKGKPISANSILEKMVQRSSNITRIVDKLTAKGLVKRTLAVDDRRKMDIIITDKGLDLLKLLDKKVEALHKPLINNLSSEEAETLKRLIIKLKGKQE